MAEFLIPGEVSSQNCYFGFLEGGLWVIEDTGEKGPLGVGLEGQRGPRRLDTPQEGSLRGPGVGCVHVPWGKPAVKKKGMAEQWIFSETPGEQEFPSCAKRTGKLGESTRNLLACAGRKSERLQQRIGPARIHLRALRELAEVVARQLCTVQQWSWSVTGVPDETGDLLTWPESLWRVVRRIWGAAGL